MGERGGSIIIKRDTHLDGVWSVLYTWDYSKTIANNNFSKTCLQPVDWYQRELWGTKYTSLRYQNIEKARLQPVVCIQCSTSYSKGAYVGLWTYDHMNIGLTLWVAKVQGAALTSGTFCNPKLRGWEFKTPGSHTNTNTNTNVSWWRKTQPDLYQDVSADWKYDPVSWDFGWSVDVMWWAFCGVVVVERRRGETGISKWNFCTK